ncbi:MAG TPA: hypothetical protein VFS50_00930 [Meiothermus sp.]|nr:hypothetical protein [Meiothermus sp.]
MGEREKAFLTPERAVAKARELGNVRLLDRFLTNCLSLHVETGEGEGARAKLEEWKTLFPEPRDPTVEGRFQERLADFLILRGNLSAAIRAAQQGIGLAHHCQQYNQQMYRRPALARLLNQLGDVKAARDVLEPLLPREPTFPAYVELRFFAELAHCDLLEGHARRALEQLEAIIAKGWHCREMGAVLNVYLGQTHLSLGDFSAALGAVRGVRGTAVLEVEALAVRLEASGRQGG